MHLIKNIKNLKLNYLYVFFSNKYINFKGKNIIN